MRHELKKYIDQRLTFCGTIQRFGQKNNFRGPPSDTILLAPLMLNETKEEVADHIWLTVGKQLTDLNCQIGNTIKFDARVTEYQKGYKGYRDDIYVPIEEDYRVSYPSKIEIVDL